MSNFIACLNEENDNNESMKQVFYNASLKQPQKTNKKSGKADFTKFEQCAKDENIAQKFFQGVKESIGQKKQPSCGQNSNKQVTQINNPHSQMSKASTESNKNHISSDDTKLVVNLCDMDMKLKQHVTENIQKNWDPKMRDKSVNSLISELNSKHDEGWCLIEIDDSCNMSNLNAYRGSVLSFGFSNSEEKFILYRKCSPELVQTQKSMLW